jgi:GTP-binding protein
VLLPIVAIVGRPNVGKSTLFNRILGQRRAIVDELPGLTRDRHYAEGDWAGRSFILLDTGGIDPQSAHPIQRQILAQTTHALDEADVTLLVMDAKDGVTPLDHEVAARVRRAGRPTLLVINKADTAAGEEALAEFYSLGVGDPMPVSALHGRGSGDLLDRVVELMPDAREVPEYAGAVRIAVVGRPNVGKSSLVNRLVGSQRMVVDETAGTTRDAVDTRFERDGRRFVIVDTAGLRREARVTDRIEYYSATRALRAVSRSDLALLVVDLGREPAKQDARLASVVAEQRKGLVVVFNKWDLVDAPMDAREAIEEEFLRQYPFLSHVPRLYVSALTGKGVHQILPVCARVYDQFVKQIPTSELNTALHEILNRVRPAASSSGGHVKFYYAAQTKTRPPTFALFVNNPRYIRDNYVRYLDKGLRERFGFEGVPLQLEWRRSR